MGLRVLVVEDDIRLARLIARALGEDGHAAEIASDGEEALDQIAGTSFDVVILDLMLPRIDGLEVCRAIREQGEPAAVLMLTARDSVPDRIIGLEAGADDYLGKPFAFSELLARVRALGRRASPGGIFQVDDLVLDPAARTVARAGRPVALTAREFDVLEQLVRNAGRAVSREQLADRVWGAETECESNVVDTYIHYLRKKLDNDRRPLIQTVRGVGYLVRMSAPDHATADGDAP